MTSWPIHTITLDPTAAFPGATRELSHRSNSRSGSPEAAEAESLDEVLTPAEVAVFLKVPEDTLTDWRYRQKGPPFHKVGRHVRYLADELRAWLSCQ